MGKYVNVSESKKEQKHVNMPSGEESLITLIQVRAFFSLSAMLQKKLIYIHRMTNRIWTTRPSIFFLHRINEFLVFFNVFHI